MSKSGTIETKASALASNPDLVEMLVMNLDTEGALDVLEALDPGTRVRVDRNVERATDVVSRLDAITHVANEGEGRCTQVPMLLTRVDNVASDQLNDEYYALAARSSSAGDLSKPTEFVFSEGDSTIKMFERAGRLLLCSQWRRRPVKLVIGYDTREMMFDVVPTENPEEFRVKASLTQRARFTNPLIAAVEGIAKTFTFQLTYE